MESDRQILIFALERGKPLFGKKAVNRLTAFFYCTGVAYLSQPHQVPQKSFIWYSEDKYYVCNIIQTSTGLKSNNDINDFEKS